MRVVSSVGRSSSHARARGLARKRARAATPHATRARALNAQPRDVQFKTSDQTLISAHQPVRQCRGILQKQIESASLYLGPPAPNVHAARKQLKRARATLRLLRSSIGRDAYAHENAAMRDVARKLAPTRDSEVLLETLKRLTHRSRVVADLPLKPLHASLRRRRAAQALQVQHRKALTLKLRDTIERRSVSDGGWACLAHGLRKTYRRGRREFREAQTTMSSERLHAWRKQTKYLWHQLQILTPLAPWGHRRASGSVPPRLGVSWRGARPHHIADDSAGAASATRCQDS